MAISASGAGVLSLLQHAGDRRVPGATAWLIVGSVLVTLASVVVACSALPPDEFPPGMVRYIVPVFAASGVVVVATGAVRPAPIVLVSTVSAVLLLAWLALFAVFLALGGDPEVIDFELGTDRSGGTTER
jgi:hypothetical protein